MSFLPCKLRSLVNWDLEGQAVLGWRPSVPFTEKLAINARTVSFGGGAPLCLLSRSSAILQHCLCVVHKPIRQIHQRSVGVLWDVCLAMDLADRRTESMAEGAGFGVSTMLIGTVRWLGAGPWISSSHCSWGNGWVCLCRILPLWWQVGPPSQLQLRTRSSLVRHSALRSIFCASWHPTSCTGFRKSMRSGCPVMRLKPSQFSCPPPQSRASDLCAFLCLWKLFFARHPAHIPHEAT